jgi:PKD repeat protein
MRIVASGLSAVVLLVTSVYWTVERVQSAAPLPQSTFKVAYYNIQSGKGTTPLSGTCSFERNDNCSDRSKPMNAWGVGAVQAELNRALQDTSILALGLSEAWNCASPAAVLKSLGWAAESGERNGVALLARYGFAATPEWFQLDTSLNVNPGDTMWVVSAPVCADASCSRAIEVFSAHWYASGDTRTQSFERQAQGTVEFMNRLAPTEPRVLIGDLNVWEEGGPVCSQTPVPTAMQILRADGNRDAWPSVHGSAEGYTGMWNRNGCGTPNGYLWKRIDQSWSKALPAPVSMTRFGMVTPGTCSPSDHAGIVAEYPWPGATSTPPANTAPVASFTSACTGLECAFTDKSSDAEAGIAAWAWTFGDGTTASSAQHPTHRYAAGGTYTVGLTVTDAAGAKSSTSRTVTATGSTAFDFALSASPETRRINVGAAASYILTASLTSGSAQAIAFSISGLPAGATASFTPPSVSGSGSSTLTVTTSAATPAGTHALVLTGTGGGLTRTAGVTLQVVGKKR